MKSFDWKKERKQFYFPEKTPSLVTVPAMPCFMIDGEGDPNGSAKFAAQVSILYQLSYTLKFELKKDGFEYGVGPLEGLWGMRGGGPFVFGNKAQFVYTLFIAQPPFVGPPEFHRGIELLREKKVKKKEGLPAELDQVRFEIFEEGEAVQILHRGSFDEEGPTVALLDDFIERSGLQFRPHHHEIYLSDFTKVAPDKLKTVIRHPVMK